VFVEGEEEGYRVAVVEACWAEGEEAVDESCD